MKVRDSTHSMVDIKPITEKIISGILPDLL